MYKINEMQIWNVEEKRLTWSLSGHQKEIYSVDYSPESSFVVSGSEDMHVKVWDVLQGKVGVSFLLSGLAPLRFLYVMFVFPLNHAHMQIKS